MKHLFTLIFGILISATVLAFPQKNLLKGHSLASLSDIAQKLRAGNDDIAAAELHEYMRNPSLLMNLCQPELKSAEAVKQRLDSLVTLEYDTIGGTWINNEVQKFIYNQYGKNTSESNYLWNKRTNSWRPEYKDIYTFSTEGYIASISEYEWDTLAANWVGIFKTENTFNSQGQVQTAQNYSWKTETAQWVLEGRTENTYDSKNNLVSYIRYALDDETGLLAAAYKIVYTYNSNNQVLTSEFQLNADGSWMAYSRMQYNYDSNGWLVLEYSYGLNYMTFIMEYSGKTEYTNNSSGDATLILDYDYSDGNWINDSKEEITYNSNKDLTSTKDYDWSLESSAWIADERTDVAYDANKNIISETYYNGNGAQGWVEDSKTAFTFNNSYTSSDIILPTIISGEAIIYFRHMVTLSNEYDWRNSQWRNRFKTTLYYTSTNITIADETSQEETGVYPNPAHDKITIIAGSAGNSQLSLYDFSGKLVFSKLFAGKTETNVNNFKPGFYIVKVNEEGGKTWQKKIVVR